MYLAVALANLDDLDNASAAYEKALELDDDMMFRLNYGMPPSATWLTLLATELVSPIRTYCRQNLLHMLCLTCLHGCSYHSLQV